MTARMTALVKAAIAEIDGTAWTTTDYPKAIFDEVEQRWTCGAEVT